MGSRLFAGLGISGVIPTVVAINVERRHKFGLRFIAEY